MHPLFGERSLLKSDNAFTCHIKGSVHRTTYAGDLVSVYRNLHNGLFSIKQRSGGDVGRVTGYARSIILHQPHFAVSELGRQRVITSKQKDIHAFARGVFFDATNEDFDIPNHARYVTYNPYRSRYFFDPETNENITGDLGEFILMHGKGAYLLG